MKNIIQEQENENNVLLNANYQQEIVEILNKRLEENLEDYEFVITSTGTNFIQLSTNTTCKTLLDFGSSDVDIYVRWAKECFENFIYKENDIKLQPREKYDERKR